MADKSILFDSDSSIIICKYLESFKISLICFPPILILIKLISILEYIIEYAFNKLSFRLTQKKNEHPFSKEGKQVLQFDEL